MNRLSVFLCTLLFCLAQQIYAKASEGWMGPNIPSINTKKGGTLLDVVDQIRAELQKDTTSSLSLRIAVSDEELSKVSAQMTVKNIPAIIALAQVAECGFYDLTFENGGWLLSNTPLTEKIYSHSIVTVTCETVTSDELAALGLTLKNGTQGNVIVDSGIKWPKEEWANITYRDGVIIFQAYYHESENFHALLKLHRAGYTIPKVNSYQPKSSANK